MRSESYCSRPVCACECVRGPHMQLSDKVGILAGLVSCSLVWHLSLFGEVVPFYFFARAFIFSARAVEAYHGELT